MKLKTCENIKGLWYSLAKHPQIHQHPWALVYPYPGWSPLSNATSGQCGKSQEGWPANPVLFDHLCTAQSGPLCRLLESERREKGDHRRSPGLHGEDWRLPCTWQDTFWSREWRTYGKWDILQCVKSEEPSSMTPRKSWALGLSEGWEGGWIWQSSQRWRAAGSLGGQAECRWQCRGPGEGGWVKHPSICVSMGTQ